MASLRWLLPVLWLSTGSVCGQTARPARPANCLEHDSRPGPRYWRGTVGPLAVTLQLDSGRWGYSGRYSYGRRGQTLYLSQATTNKKGQTRLDETTDWKPTGYFLFTAPLRGRLIGTWRSPDGRRTLPVALHETCAGALAYDEETWYLNRFAANTDYEGALPDSASFTQSYLRLRPPLNAATRRIQRALGPPVAPPKMGHYLDSLLRTQQEERPDYYFSGDTYVVYNSNFLLSVVQFERFSSAFYDDGSYSHERSQCSTYDLRTGRRLTLADLLLPSYGPQLRRWLLQQLKPVWENANYGQVGATGKLPVSGFLVTGTGLRFSYDDRDDESLANPGPYHADREIEVEIPYETLLPFLRPDGPLTALLQERHLLPRK